VSLHTRTYRPGPFTKQNLTAFGRWPLPDGRQTTPAVVRTGAARGPHDCWADEAADDLRQLRAAFGHAEGCE
jgi:hypothetical protein